MKELQKVVKNRVRVPKSLPCLQTLGSQAMVSSFGKFYEHQAEGLMLVVASKLLKFSEEEVYDSKEFAVYKKALGDITGFFTECWMETQKKDLQVTK